MNYWHELDLRPWMKHQQRGDRYLPWRAWIRMFKEAEFGCPLRYQPCPTQRSALEAGLVEGHSASSSTSYDPLGKDGRGIVIPAGGRLLAGAYATVRGLHELGCQLPVELWHLGPQEMPNAARKKFEGLGVVVRDALAEREKHPCWQLGGWQLKPYAIILSGFREVLYLDADSHPIKDPTYLFDEPLYKDTGALFWPDRVRHGPESGLWDIFGVPYRDEPQHETGQMMFDTARCWHALQIAMHCNEHSRFHYQHSHGDTATFRFAFHALGQPFSVIPHRLIEVPVDRQAEDIETLKTTEYMRQPGDIRAVFLQRDPNGEVIFQHRTGGGGAQVDFSFGGTRRIQHCVAEDSGIAAVAELKDAIERDSTFVETTLLFHPDKVSRRRQPGIVLLFDEAERRGLTTIVETGTLRQKDNWEFDGGMTWHFGRYAQKVGGQVYTVDISPTAVALAEAETKEFAQWIAYVESDSVAYLKERWPVDGKPIDLLFLDSFDYEAGKHGEAQLHNLNEVLAALPHMNPKGLIAIDDCSLEGGGKGGMSVQYLSNSGWKVLHKGYMAILGRE